MRQTKSQDIQKRIKQTVKALSAGIWEKDRLIAMGILCCVSGESLFLLGPPGTGKSLIARRLKEVFGDSRAFEYLMSRFSTPDEIFGPVSIRKLREKDCYERCTDGYLPSADIVFLDEIWKAGPAIQNALLTVLNEKIFQNGAVTMKLPLKLLIAASNELPKEDEGLEALWDRFLIRCVSDCIENEAAFYKMLRQDTPATVEMNPFLRISAAELETWNRAITGIELPDNILKTITRIRLELKALSKAENTDSLDFYVSDRRWKKTVRILRTSAFLNNRSSVDQTDLLLLFHILWNKTECMGPVATAVIKSLFAEIQSGMEELTRKTEYTPDEEKQSPEAQAPSKAESTFKVYNYFYVKLLPSFPTAQPCDIYFVLNDYSQLSLSKPSTGIRYRDDRMGGDIVRTLSAPVSGLQGQAATVSLLRGQDSVLINGKEYFLEKSSSIGSSINSLINRQYIPDISHLHLEEEVHSIRKSFDSLKSLLIDSNGNIFISGQDIRPVKKYAQTVERTINALEVKIESMQTNGV